MPTWMCRLPEAEAARQAAHRERRQNHGNCIRCGGARDPRSKQLCTKHLLAQRKATRARLGLKGVQRRFKADTE